MMDMDTFRLQFGPAVRKLFGASGPGALILIRWGFPEADIGMYVEFAIAVVPLIVSLVWGWSCATPAARVDLVRKLSDVEEIVVRDNPNARGLREMAASDKFPEVKLASDVRRTEPRATDYRTLA